MALGKKSFLIRDILECQGQSGAIPSLPSNPRLIEWIIQSRLEQFNQSSLWSRDHSVEVDRDGPSSSVIEGNSLPCDSPDLNPNVAISPLIHNWLSINRFANRVTAPNHPYMSCPQAEKFPMRSMTPLPSHLYQNLYYYAIQQQINASLVGKSSVNEESCLSPSQQQAQQSILKNVKGKANSSRLRRPPSMINSLARKRINSKAKKPNNKVIKKVVHVESNQLTINEQSDNQYETGLDLTQNGDNKHWEAECNCDEDDDNEEDTGANKCAAKSKCKKLRRNRTVFTELQLMGLERRFDSQKYLSTPDRADLARALGLTQLQVKTWYQNRRMKWKKQVMQNGCPYPPTKPKGRPKKDSIPTYGMEFTNSILCPIFASHGNGTGQPSTNATTTLVSFTHNLTTSNVDSPLQ